MIDTYWLDEKGLPRVIDQKVYRNDINSVPPICKDMKSVPELCSIYVRMTCQETFMETDLVHINEQDINCKYGDECHVYIED